MGQETHSADLESARSHTAPDADNAPGALATAMDSVLVVDEGGAVVAMNAAAETRFGGAPPEISAQQLLRMVGKPALVQGDTGARTQYVFVIRDVQQSDAAFQRVLRAERRAAVEETMHALAHDCRNALQRMQSCLTLMRLRGNEEVQFLVEDMQATQDRLHRFYEDAQSAVAPLQLDRREADVRKLVERVWRQLRLMWSEKAVGWSVRLDGQPATRANVDSQRLGQALRSLLESAIEVSPANGTVGCVFRRRANGNGGALELAIEDSGPPVSDHGTGHGFLYRTKRRGSAVGLAAAERIVVEHDGEIMIDDRPEGGARVVITLPQEA